MWLVFAVMASLLLGSLVMIRSSPTSFPRPMLLEQFGHVLMALLIGKE
jgi:hypothetical protein